MVGRSELTTGSWSAIAPRCHRATRVAAMWGPGQSCSLLLAGLSVGPGLSYLFTMLHDASPGCVMSGLVARTGGAGWPTPPDQGAYSC